MRDPLNLRDHYDIAVIGGGVHGAAVAWEASLTGAKVCLFEQDDFGAAVSANSLKIIHGGLRYLQHFDIKRTRAYAREQERLLSWFPHLIQPLPCVMPTYKDWRKGRWSMRAGIAWYDFLAGHRSLPSGNVFSRDKARSFVRSVWRDEMTGGALWFDAQVYNGERLVLSYVLSARASGADVVNHMRVVGIEEANGALRLDLSDQLNGSAGVIIADHVVNAGASDFGSDGERGAQPYVRAVNLVFNRPYADTAVGVQLPGAAQFAGGRLLFITPWRGRSVVGTWYFPDRPEPVITRDELTACLKDLSTAVPGEQWSEDEIGLIHVGRLPVDGDGQLLENPRVYPSKVWPQMTNIIGVKYSNARLVAQEFVARRYGKPRRERIVYGAGFTDPDQYRSDLQQRWSSVLDDETLSHLYRNYGDICDQILPADQQGAPTRIGDSAIFVQEIEHVCEHELAYTLQDVLIRRTGLGELMRPPEEIVSICAQQLAKRYNWDDARVQKERDDLHQYYQRVVDK